MMQVIVISDIVCGKTEFNLTARVIHLWSIPDRTNTSEEGSIHMVLVVAKVMRKTIFKSARKSDFL